MYKLQVDKKTFSCSIGAPFSANGMYAPVARGVLKRTKKYNEWIEKNQPLLEEALLPAKEFPISLKVVVMGGRGFNSMTKNDIDNLKKPLCDLLVRAKIVPDDEKKYISRVEISYLPSPTSGCEPLTFISYEEPEPEIIEWTAPYFWEKE